MALKKMCHSVLFRFLCDEGMMQNKNLLMTMCINFHLSIIVILNFYYFFILQIECKNLLLVKGYLLFFELTFFLNVFIFFLEFFNFLSFKFLFFIYSKELMEFKKLNKKFID